MDKTSYITGRVIKQNIFQTLNIVFCRFIDWKVNCKKSLLSYFEPKKTE